MLKSGRVRLNALLLLAFLISPSFAVSASDPQNSNQRVRVMGLVQSLRHDAASAEQAAKALASLGPAAEPALPDLMEALRYDEESVYAAVREAVIKIGPASIRPLQSMLDDGNFIVRRRAVEILGQFGADAKRVVPALIELLSDAQFEVSAAAQKALVQIGPAAVPALADALRKGGERQRQTLIATLGQCGPTAVPILLEALKKSANAFVRLNAATAVSRIRPLDPGVVPALTAVLADLEDGVRGAAVDALGEIGPDAKAAIGPLVAVSLDDKDALIRQKASNALGRIGSAGPDSLPGLISGLRHPEVEVRRRLIAALASSDIPLAGALPVLTTALKDADPGVRLGVVEGVSALSKNSAQAMPVLRQALADAVPDVRAAAIRQLGRMNESAAEAAAELGRALNDPNPVLRQQAIQALGQLGKEGLPGLLQALGDSYGVLSDHAAQAILRIGPEAVPALQALENGSDPAMKKKAAQLLKRLQAAKPPQAKKTR